LIASFKFDLFRGNFFGGTGYESVSLFDQVRATMLVTVFVFLGIEGASVYSRFAQKREDIGAATIMGFIGVTCLMVLVTLLPFGVLERADMAGMRQPSMAAVLEAIVGPWGAIFISVGLLVSVLGAYLAWSLICAEVLFAAARNADLPKLFVKENENKVPVAALWLSNIVVQIFVISTYWSQDAFTLMLSMTSVMTLIPFFLVALYGFRLVKGGETYDVRPEDRKGDYILATVAVIYTAFLLYAAGWKFTVLSGLLYAPGTILYIWTRREQGKVLFRPFEWLIFGVAVILALIAVHGLATGYITI
jgi:arginine:ornithine antiporter/lysine permease